MFKKITSQFNKTKALSVGVTLLGLAGTILSGKIEDYNRQDLKEELKKEVLDELRKGDN